MTGFLDREQGLYEAERLNRLLGLRLKYIPFIVLAVAAQVAALKLGAPAMISVLIFIAVQFLCGIALGIWEVKHARRFPGRRSAQPSLLVPQPGDARRTPPIALGHEQRLVERVQEDDGRERPHPVGTAGRHRRI